MHIITEESILMYETRLREEEKAAATVRKYADALRKLCAWLGGEAVTKRRLLAYRDELLQRKQPQTVNGELSAIHAYLDLFELKGEKVRFLKVQNQPFLDESRELQEQEYKRLLETAQRRGNERLYLVMMTLCSTGMRVSELAYVTLEATKAGYTHIRMKGKCRKVLLPKALCQKLQSYARKAGIVSGFVFRTRSGRPLDRTNIGHDMKKLCAEARVEERKVFPHNLRHLFARCFMVIENNIAHLADVLGHSRIETTRRYVAVSAKAHNRILSRMHLII